VAPRVCELAGPDHFHTPPPHRSLAQRLLTQLSVSRGNPSPLSLWRLTLGFKAEQRGLDIQSRQRSFEDTLGKPLLRRGGWYSLLGHTTALLWEGAQWCGQEGVHATPPASSSSTSQF